MKISVIIPTYNREKYIRRALDSLLGQDFNPAEFEVLVINDGGKDSTGKIVKSYEGRLAIKFFDEPRLGVSRARNVGITNSTAPVLAFFDDDAKAEKTWLSQIDCLAKQNEVMVGRGLPYTDNFWQYFAPHYDRGSKPAEIQTIWECNLTVRRDVFDKVGLFNENMEWGHEGNEFAARLRGKYKIMYRPEILIYHDYAFGLANYLKKQFKFGEQLAHLEAGNEKIKKNWDEVRNEKLEQLDFFRKMAVKIIARLGGFAHLLGWLIGTLKYGNKKTA